MTRAAALRVMVLGAPDVRYQDRPVKFRSRKELALLIYLIIEGGQHSREKLVGFFWPDSDRPLGHASLRNTLTRTRQALCDAGDYLRVNQGLLSIDDGLPGDIDVDVQSVRAALQTIQESSGLGGPADLSSLLAAVAAYRGEFLEGFSLVDAPAFDDWSGRQREAWHRRLERILNRLSRLQLEQGQLDQAIETTQRWIAHNALHEAAYRRLMQVQFLAGNRTAALEAFERCASVLADELGVRPDAATLALAERVRTAALSIPSTIVEDQAPRLPELPFVGRAAEHSLLVAAYHAAVQGTPRAACLVGEAGIGKTRLAQMFLAWASIQQADILTGRTFEVGGQLPYHPLVAALRERLAHENAPADLLADVWLAELSRLLPELRERYPDLPSPTGGDPSLARFHLYEAIAQLSLALAGRRPLVLWIDDLQWADAATLEVLPYLCRRWVESNARLLLLVAVRQEALAATPRMREWLTQVGRELNVARVDLRPLTVEAARQVVHALADPSAEHQAASRHFGDWLHAETAGQPYFMAETIKMLVEREVLQAGQGTVDFRSAIERIQGGGELPMPPTVREVILARLERVSETAGTLLAAGAVLGQACGFERLCQVAGLDELAALPALDELVKVRLLLEAADTRRPYSFAHDKIRDVVYAEAGDARRRLYHRRACEGLQAEAAPAAELASHAFAARLWEPAVRYSLVAGDQAAGVYAHVEAARHYRRALDVAKHEHEYGEDPARPGETGKTMTHLYLRLGRMLELSSAFAEATATYDEMEGIARARGDRAMELAALLARITPLATVTAVFDPARAELLAGRALQLARELGDEAAEADILWNQLNIYRNTNRLSQGAAYGERALALARRLDRRERMAYILLDLGYCFGFMADFVPATAYAIEAGTLWRALGNLPMVADTLIGVCGFRVFTGDYDGAITAFEEALHIGQTTGTLWALAGCRHNIGRVFADRGEVVRAIDEMEEGIRLSEQAGFISPLIIVPSDLASLYRALGACERGLALARGAVKVAETRLPLFRVYALAALAYLLLAQGDVNGAGSVVDQMRSDPNRDGWGIFPSMILQAEAELALAQGANDRAGELAEQALHAARQITARAFFPAALDLQARARLGLGRPHEARERWAEARREAEALGARVELWPVLSALSRLEADPYAADRLCRQAREVVAAIADRAPQDLRTIFLDLPAVRAVFDNR